MILVLPSHDKLKASSSPFIYILSGMSKFDKLLGLEHIYLDLLLLKIIVLSLPYFVQILSNLNKADDDGAIIHVPYS